MYPYARFGEEYELQLSNVSLTSLILPRMQIAPEGKWVEKAVVLS